MIGRLLSALGAVGIRRVCMMPDVTGLAGRIRRSAESQRRHGWPELIFLDMPVDDGPADTLRAVERMVEAGVRVIVVLGGDGTHRLVAMACGETPLVALSTGTNNAFPGSHEATIAGLAAGLVATGLVPARQAVFRNKVLRLESNGTPRGLAVVDASVTSDRWIGAKALWRPENLSQIFVAFSEPHAIGVSSIAGLLRPVARNARHGLRIDLAPLGQAPMTLMAPIAPGLIVPLGIAAFDEIRFGERHLVRCPEGVVAVDGEREIEFGPGDQVAIRLEQDGPFTIDIDLVMHRAAREGLLVNFDPTRASVNGEYRKSVSHAAW
ncbi:MAG: NAD(+)/NADH kinase [Bryobacteraceae bacterium]